MFASNSICICSREQHHFKVNNNALEDGLTYFPVLMLQCKSNGHNSTQRENRLKPREDFPICCQYSSVFLYVVYVLTQ